MPRSLKQTAAPSRELRHFTNRTDELKVFHDALDLPADTPLPVLMFYGVGGIGKSWLLRRLRQELPGTLPSALLDFEPSTGGTPYHTDSARSLAELRRQLSGVDCPRFDLAYAWLRHKEGSGDEPLLSGSGAAGTAFEFLREGATSLLIGVPGGNLLTWLASKSTKPLWNQVKGTWLEAWLASQVGQDDFLLLRRLTAQEIYPALAERLLHDLAEKLPRRAGKACCGVFFIDTFEALRLGLPGGAQGHEREQWVRNLHATDAPLLLVLVGRDRLRWDECDPEYQNPRNLQQHLVGGLSEFDAAHFLQRCGVGDLHVRRAVLRVSVEIESEPAEGKRGYHPFTLGLCADAIINEQTAGRTVDPATFDMAPGDTGRLAQRFLKSLGDFSHEVWVKRLALTPRFDEDAARTACSPVRDAAQDAAWQTLQRYSFVSETDEAGWWTLHVRMRDALARMAGADAAAGHRFWECHWRGRSRSEVDDAAALAWYHRYALDAKAAAKEWIGQAVQLRSRRHMADHERVLSWWEPIGLLRGKVPTREEAGRLNDLGVEYVEASQGDRAENLRQAIDCHQAALRVRTEADFPADWAMTQNNLGTAYLDLPTGHRAENVWQAIDCYQAALRVHTEADFPAEWAMTQNNLGTAYLDLPTGHRAENVWQAIDCYQAALRVYTEADFPADWAMTHYNLGNGYSELPRGDRAENLRQAIACYQAALRVRTEADFPALWAMTQNNLGIAYRNLPKGDRAENLGQAVTCYEAALRVYTEADFPADWAMMQHNLGAAYWNLPTGNRAEYLPRAITCYEAALRVYTEADFPAYWATTQNNLSLAYGELPTGNRAENLQRAIDCCQAALRVRTEADFPADWAMTQNNLGIAFWNLPTGDREENLRHAIASYEAALRVYTESDFPAQWATTLNNLGFAIKDLPTGDRGENLRLAIASFQAALRVRTEADFPGDWAQTHFNLGLAYEDLADLTNERSATNCAVTCFEAAVHGFETVGLSKKANETRQRAEQLRNAMTAPQTPD